MGLENHEQACPIVLRLLGMLDEKNGEINISALNSIISNYR